MDLFVKPISMTGEWLSLLLPLSEESEAYIQVSFMEIYKIKCM